MGLCKSNQHALSDEVSKNIVDSPPLLIDRFGWPSDAECITAAQALRDSSQSSYTVNKMPPKLNPRTASLRLLILVYSVHISSLHDAITRGLSAVQDKTSPPFLSLRIQPVFLTFLALDKVSNKRSFIVLDHGIKTPIPVIFAFRQVQRNSDPAFDTALLQRSPRRRLHSANFLLPISAQILPARYPSSLLSPPSCRVMDCWNCLLGATCVLTISSRAVIRPWRCR